MKINYTMFGTGLTGGTKVIFEIANKLVERGHDVSVIALGKTSHIAWYPLKANIRFIHIPMPIKMIRRGLKALFNYTGDFEYELRALARTTPECDINVATYCLTAFSVFRSGKGMPFYHMQHYEPLFFNDPYHKKIAEETYYLPLNRIANSTWLKKQLEEKHGIRDIELLFPAIDHTVFYPRPRKKASNKKRIISLVKDISWKGFSDVIETMRILHKERKDVELFCFGTSIPDIDYSNIPIRIFKNLINEELAELYCECDVFISASWYESFPLPPLEAMACGVPVVTTEFGTEDYCIHGRNCIVVPARKPKQMVEAILEILEDNETAERLREEGLKTAKQFTWEKTAERVEKLFLAGLRGAQ